jgi:nicotinamidase-related amidase
MPAIAPAKSALLVIDLQTGMFNGEQIAPIHAGDALLEHTKRALAYARQARLPVFYVRHGEPAGRLLERGTANWQIHQAIAPLPGEPVIDKMRPDSFHETSLASDLEAAGITRLIVTGAQTEICVDTTCRRASSLGFEVVLVSDGHSTWDNATLTADQIIRHTNETLAGRFVRLARHAELGEWLRRG